MNEHHGKVHWNELATREVDKAVAYYTDICGWEFEAVDMGMGLYHVGNLNGVPTAGIFDMSDMPGMEELPAHWMAYLAVTDLDASLASTKAHGGAVVRDPFEVPGVGRMAVVSDPGGAVLSLMVPSS
jgi:predicted enzyme related to lactoylglutathione lyase